MTRRSVPATGVPASGGQFILERRARLVRGLMPRGGHLLDFGCGNGAQTLHFAEDFDEVTGVDIAEDYLADFRGAIAARGLGGRFRTLATGGGPVPLPDASVDVLTSFTVLEHVPDEMAVLAEFRRLLKPGGRLVLTVPNKWWIFETHGADLPLLPWNRVPLVSWWPRHLHDRWARARIYRRRDILALLAAAGFEPDRSFRMTAPLDVIRWKPLRDLLRRTVFRPDRAPIPILATEIVVAATR